MKVLLGMSGGLDSTYAARNLMEQGHTVEGAILRMHEFTDVEGAVRSAESLGIPLHVIDCTEDFEMVKADLASAYVNGKTPNPCIVCNREVKFKRLHSFAKKLGFDKIATGHYARIVDYTLDGSTKRTFARAKDSRKDQTYMLYRVPGEIIDDLILPLSDLVKTDVKDLAKKASLVFDERESQEICFIPDGDYASFVESRFGKSEKGRFIDEAGRVLGEHQGIIRYTIGQRKGLGISLGERAFVTKIDAEFNTVTLSSTPILASEVELCDMTYTAFDPPSNQIEMRVEAKVRYLASPVPATAVLRPDGSATVTLDIPAKSVTPGQSCVLYDGDVLLCGGFINSSK